MEYILIGVLGFVFMLIFDVLSMRDNVLGKYFFAFAGLGMIVYSTIEIVNLSNYVFVLDVLTITSLVFAAVFAMLLVYSVFIEVGTNTYQKHAEPKLVTNGTYCLSRHPGVIWLFLTLLFAALFFRNGYLLFAAIIWTITNIVYIAIQEKLIFVKIFKNYDEYKKHTPMVIPNINSIRKFITESNWRKR
jgi:protein-S-isoprenylcysteine O-methyltransferase Ste14